ncbi:MAG: preprotein translocase subunit SecY [Bacteroidetes bacterium SW_11_45_7]|nr:MAG: preprotein translocase subunit SecY [Bacteroidetes bacterium SW_11_45_7]
MKSFFNTLKNIYNIEDLRNRIMITLGLILIYRVGTYVVLPGINPAQLDELAQQSSGGVLGLVNLFAVSASIAVQLLTLAVPYFQKLQKEGQTGKRQINQITRYLTVVITAAQAIGYVANLRYIAGEAIIINPTLFYFSTIIVLTAGTLFVMWIGEKISDKGIGNGISILIMIGIIANLPFALVAELSSRMNEGGGLVPFIIEIAILVAIVSAVIMLVQGVRRIPVQYAKRGENQYGGVRQFIPLKVNSAGVMPIIFAQAMMFLPSTVAQFFPGADPNTGILASFSDPTSIPYSIANFALVVLFTYFYTALIVKPVQMADDMKKNGGFIPGVKPGKKTAEFIDSVMSRITLPGSIFLGLVAIMPTFAMMFGINQQFALFFGGTSLLIMVGVVLDTLQQIESHLLMRQYDGLMKSGKMKGRSTSSVGASL